MRSSILLILLLLPIQAHAGTASSTLLSGAEASQAIQTVLGYPEAQGIDAWLLQRSFVQNLAEATAEDVVSADNKRYTSVQVPYWNGAHKMLLHYLGPRHGNGTVEWLVGDFWELSDGSVTGTEWQWDGQQLVQGARAYKISNFIACSIGAGLAGSLRCLATGPGWGACTGISVSVTTIGCYATEMILSAFQQ